MTGFQIALQWWWKICFEWGILVAIMIAMAAGIARIYSSDHAITGRSWCGQGDEFQGDLFQSELKHALEYYSLQCHFMIAGVLAAMCAWC